MLSNGVMKILRATIQLKWKRMQKKKKNLVITFF